MNASMFIVIDTETTGTDPAVDQVVELGYVGTDMQGVRFQDSCLVKPTVPISAGASACHHLIDDDLASAPPLSTALEALKHETDGCEEAIFYVAHNAPFDKSFLPTLTDKPWLDTYRMAKRYLPELPHHTNQFLRYHLRLDVPRNIPAHRALGDCIVTAALLRYLLNGPANANFERMGTKEFELFIDSPLLLQTVAFGKHAGRKWAEVPRDYLAWMLRTGGFDADTTYTATTYLEK